MRLFGIVDDVIDRFDGACWIFFGFDGLKGSGGPAVGSFLLMGVGR